MNSYNMKKLIPLDVPEFLYDYGEIYNFCVEKGALTEEERFKISEHVIMSIKMLENP
ncbi:HD domain-containing phosphohydrolase [sulfur-oxidizing endosymbiont of Gigantopelta aegis]|uniref:HD domain-containing phosphohydrolase n=1 Tax=sulfur-oxidizing endosymbiont of Gigantopelta aegis TaxID=2794934 RepID=UPI0018DCA2C2|nr:HD domain-containing phosphohydrolase [sulfur-oxidizing endosymbiont of Gigantopelta aegis]